MLAVPLAPSTGTTAAVTAAVLAVSASNCVPSNTLTLTVKV